MFLLTAAQCLLGKSVQVKLPKKNMVIDPRPNNQRIEIRNRSGVLVCSLKFGRFDCVYQRHDDGTTVTLTRVVDNEVFENRDTHTHTGTCTVDTGAILASIEGPFEFRVYDPDIEAVPLFNSTVYTFLGVFGERPPPDTTVLIIDQSVKDIPEKAFADCWNLKKCIMNDGVETIGMWAFLDCSAMKAIKLSRSLKHIGQQAFESCSSLEAIFLPSSVEIIESGAFACCTNIRILRLPLDVDVPDTIFYYCEAFFETTQIQDYLYDYTTHQTINIDEVHQAVINFYTNLPPLHQACLDTDVNAQSLHDCVDTHGPDNAALRDHDGMTPLHILAMNPHADVRVVGACFRVDMNAAVKSDNRGNTPLDYLKVHHDIEYHTFLMASLCMYREMMIKES